VIKTETKLLQSRNAIHILIVENISVDSNVGPWHFGTFRDWKGWLLSVCAYNCTLRNVRWQCVDGCLSSFVNACRE